MSSSADHLPTDGTPGQRIEHVGVGGVRAELGVFHRAVVVARTGDEKTEIGRDLSQARAGRRAADLPMNSWFDARFFGQVFVTLLVIMDPPGSVPIFLSLTGAHTRKARNRSADLAVVTALTVIVSFALFGQQVLQYLHVTLAALEVSGGLLLLLVALELLMGWSNEHARSDDVNVSMVPLGTP